MFSSEGQAHHGRCFKVWSQLTIEGEQARGPVQGLVESRKSDPPVPANGPYAFYTTGMEHSPVAAIVRTWGAHERISVVKRTASPPGAPGST
jgi:hypothetical protein